jgi:protein-disulfide isomerase
MNIRYLVLVLAGLIAGVFATATVIGAANSAPPSNKAEIEEIVRSYILSHPEIIEEAMGALERKKSEAAQAASKSAIKENAEILFNSKRQVVLGNPKGDVTIVEFFDYNCTYCKRSVGDMVALLQQDKNVRFVLKEFPVLGQGSVEAAQIAIAVHRIAPTKYLDFHTRLLGSRGEANRARAIEVAAAVGVDGAALEAELKNAEVSATLEETYSLANGLGLTGTPSYILGESVIPGAIGLDRLKAQIADMRNCGSTRC